MGQEDMLQLQAKSSRVATEDQGQVHKEKKSHADIGPYDTHQHKRDQRTPGGKAEG